MKISLLGLPRIGAGRELKNALEGFWSGRSDSRHLEETGRTIRRNNWKMLAELGFDYIPCNDFSFYDRMLDMSLALGIVPERFAELSPGSWEQYFAMARGTSHQGHNLAAMEMTKWFNTNYHYLVPELPSKPLFHPNAAAMTETIREAVAMKIKPMPTIIGPLTFLMLSRLPAGCRLDDYFPALADAYIRLLSEIADEEISVISLEEPALVLDESAPLLPLLHNFLADLRRKAGAKVFVHTYFDSVSDRYEAIMNLPINGVGLDFIHGPENLELLRRHGLPVSKQLFAGVIDGRNIWRADAFRIENIMTVLSEKVPINQLTLSTSCSLLHCPVTLKTETAMPDHYRRHLAFAAEKAAELAELKKVYDQGQTAPLEAMKQLRLEFLQETTRYNPAVKELCATAGTINGKRTEPFAERIKQQQAQLHLPPLPTTTIGSFPQTAELRQFRKSFRNGHITADAYRDGIRNRIADIIKIQEDIGLDVLVHGEFERNDMVEFFGERLKGFLFTANGWVQSYGSRCVKPPVIFGDVSRPTPMTVEEIVYARSLTAKPVKGMLTGPVTMLNWSFVRDDLPRAEVCMQLALAIRDEVMDLERSGINIIQVDEAALREGLPLRRERRADYLRWAVEAFRVAVGGVKTATQIHTHMCYSNFNDIIDAIIAMDADVISIENSRSGNELLQVFRSREYPNQIGPGVYDIHTPNIPSIEEIKAEISGLLAVLPIEKLWINPDCGLKTRRYEEAIPSLRNMVAAVHDFRARKKS